MLDLRADVDRTFRWLDRRPVAMLTAIVFVASIFAALMARHGTWVLSVALNVLMIPVNLVLRSWREWDDR